MSETRKITINKKKCISLLKKFIFLVIAILVMAFAQGLLSYTSKIGMAPVDSFIKSLGALFHMEYQNMNYITVFIIVGVAIIFAKPKDRLITSTAFVTGYALALLVSVFIGEVIKYLPGLEYIPPTDDDAGYGVIKAGKMWTWGLMWFFVAWISLVISIGIWINVGFGLRPYDVMIIRTSERFPRHGYVFYRNMFDSSFVCLSLILSGLSMLTAPNFEDSANWLMRNSVGVGTIFFVFATGYATNFTKKIFSKIV